MGAEELVDVTYRGLEVGKEVKLTELGPSTGFLEVVKPLPVGSEVGIATAAGEVRARVLRVHEQVAGVEHPGMRVVVIEPSPKLDKWWKALADRQDPIIPETPVDPSAALLEPEAAPEEAVPEEAAPEEAAPAAEAVPEEAAPEAIEAAPEEAAPEAIEDQVTEPQRGRKKKPARTQLMSADEIRAAVAEGGHEVSYDGEPNASPPDAGDTMQMGSGAVAEADESGDSDGNSKKTKRKRKRKRKR